MNSASEECNSETFWLVPMLLKAFCHGRLEKNSLGASPSCQSIAKASGCPSATLLIHGALGIYFGGNF